ncbi:hypothetical protein QQS21_001490 [Conoideocrella luteorostrata]|uniref:Uncharacterized protein n=1 Tax=Conoideocrella luteorostrata TaxID=1105319 RepID=A0AAJ0FXI6_9HYPO|nr:hypothetical protein QQS21_001490 [Conoideocrella luteorostrata]
MRQSSAFILALRLVFSCIGCVHADDQSQNSTILNSNLLGDYDRCEQKCWEEHRDAAYEPVQVKINCDEVEDFKCLPWEYNVESIQREYGDVDEEDYNVLCALRSWEKAGCRRAAQECKNSPNIKRCCDDRWYIPYESGPLYNGYLAGCAPEYVLKSHDSPEHKDENCDGVEDIISKMEFTSGLGAEIDYRLLGRRKAEKRVCTFRSLTL